MSLINVNHPIVQKLNDLVADDQKETAKKFLDILYNTALLESGYSVKNTHDYSMRIRSTHAREVKQIEDQRPCSYTTDFQRFLKHFQ